MQPKPSVLVPINDSPVIPPLGHVEEGGAQLSAPQSSPGTTSPLPRRQQQNEAPPVPVVVPVIIPSASAPASAPPASAAPAPAPASAPGG